MAPPPGKRGARHARGPKLQHSTTAPSEPKENVPSAPLNLLGAVDFWGQVTPHPTPRGGNVQRGGGVYGHASADHVPCRDHCCAHTAPAEMCCEDF